MEKYDGEIIIRVAEDGTIGSSIDVPDGLEWLALEQLERVKLSLLRSAMSTESI